jgi:hypothetical protein
MKIVYNDGEKERIESRYKECKDHNMCTVFDDENPDTEYVISFKVTNPAVAQYILLGLLNNKLKDVDLGIDVREIHFNHIHNKDEIKEKLHKLIDEVLK